MHEENKNSGDSHRYDNTLKVKIFDTQPILRIVLYAVVLPKGKHKL
jgi:hypothetical protein